MSDSTPGDVRDTTTPKAMATTLNKLVLGDSLAPAQRKQIRLWLTGNHTGNTRIRSGVPSHWVVADKTGSGDYGTTNDVGIIWPTHKAPIVIAIYFTGLKRETQPQDDIIAKATRVVITTFRRSDGAA